MSSRTPTELRDTIEAQRTRILSAGKIRDKIDEANNGKIASVSDELRCLASLLTAASGEETRIRLCDIGQMVASLQDRLQNAKDEIEEAITQLGDAS